MFWGVKLPPSYAFVIFRVNEICSINDWNILFKKRNKFYCYSLCDFSEVLEITLKVLSAMFCVKYLNTKHNLFFAIKVYCSAAIQNQDAAFCALKYIYYVFGVHLKLTVTIQCRFLCLCYSSTSNIVGCVSRKDIVISEKLLMQYSPGTKRIIFTVQSMFRL